ncbi:hypothetical protein AS27_08466, partial [Aptenodytes forsteri]
WSKLGALLHLKLFQLSSKSGVEYCCRTTDPSAVLTCLNVQERHFLIHVGKVPAKQKLQDTSRLTPAYLPCCWLCATHFVAWSGNKVFGCFFLNCNASFQREMKTGLNAEYMHSNKRRAIQHMDAKCPFTAPIQTQHPPP